MKDDAMDAFNLWFAYTGGDIDSTDLGAAMLAFETFYDEFTDGDIDAAEMVLGMEALGFEPTDALLGLGDDGIDDLGDDFDYDL